MPKILLCPDVPGWCWAHQASGIQRYASSGYDVHVAMQQEIQERKEDSQWLRQWDAILHFSWVDCPFLFGMRRLVTLVAHEGLMWHHVRDESNNVVMTHWPQYAAATPQRNFTNARKTLPRVDHVIAVSRPLAQFVTERIGQPNCTYVPAGVDHNILRPLTPVANETKLRIGWCGQQGAKTKGRDWVLEPLMQSMSTEFRFLINDASHLAPLSQQQMVEWYNTIDVLVCTSISEGTPMPPLEAMACGRPVVTTPVGDMPDVLGGTDAGLLMPGYINDGQSKRTVEYFVQALKSLTHERVREMGQAARARIEDACTWERLAPKWLEAIAG